ncbi:hypothetical protein BZZ01_00820 [Nostocales cyanobacterium HT-58-2]|nr:hypothetical protein BZZ01_00820 [Nostocales cyanobacterium HT-58-2]
MTLVGWVVGGIASIGIEKTIVEILPPVVLQQKIWYLLAKHFSSGVFAFIFGTDQALVLRRYISGWLWLFVTSIGWLIANGISAEWINYITSIASSLNNHLSPQQTIIFGLLSTIAYILSGIWLGLFQWLVLRRYTTGAWWWIFLPSVSFLFISILIWLLSLVQEFVPAVNRAQVVYLSGQGLTALVLGVIPAIGLCRLKTYSRST